MLLEILTWLGIILCLTQSAMFSGLNLAFFSVSRLRLEVDRAGGNDNAAKVLAMRDDANFLLTTILWGNVGINVLLTLLSSSVLAGVSAFIFSTLFITLLGEILPQAYFSRHALRFAALFTPVLKIYQVLLFPFAKPSAMVLDAMLGKEGTNFFKEKDLSEMIKLHMKSASSDIEYLEGRGALNFLSLDDLLVTDEGEYIDPTSVIRLPFTGDIPVCPAFTASAEDPFLLKIQASGRKWVILVDEAERARYVMEADAFLREAFFAAEQISPLHFCHRPVIFTDPATSLEEAILSLSIHPKRLETDVIDHDIILFWGDHKRIITGADILGRLLRGIIGNRSVDPALG